MPDSDFKFDPDFLPPRAADTYLHQLLTGICWQQDTIRVFGREHTIPRQHQWYADSDVNYRWSGLEMQPLEWIGPLSLIRDRLQQETGQSFNSVLANLYRDGNDSMGWHSDDEPELGPQPIIASISLGAERDFQLRRRKQTGKKNNSGPAANRLLSHGSLLLMSGNSQRDWQHALPKRLRVNKPRINLTFRLVEGQTGPLPHSTPTSVK